MSYCRPAGDSDVYAFASGPCSFSVYCGGESYHETTLQGFQARLEALRERGFKVPQRTFDRIGKERAEE